MADVVTDARLPDWMSPRSSVLRGVLQGGLYTKSSTVLSEERAAGKRHAVIVIACDLAVWRRIPFVCC